MSCSSLKQIIPRLFIGSIADANDFDVLVASGVSHVLCVSVDFVPKFESEELKFLVIPVEDNDNGNLLPHLDQCFQFIEAGRREGAGGALVTCSCGNSASGAVCIAYLARRLKIPLKESLELVRDSKKTVRPNAAFVAQLKAYYDTLTAGTASLPSPLSAPAAAEPPVAPLPEPVSDASVASAVVGVESLSLAATAQQPTALSAAPLEEWTTDYYEPMEDAPAPDTAAPATVEQQTAPAYFCCKMCRQRLFDERDVTPHEVGEGQTAFKWHKRANTGEPACTSLFLNEMDWMGDVSDVVGKLCCPKCQSRVGSFSWAGGQCSCGAWQTPSFQVLRARVDEKRLL
eukprot:TRINITY_DN11013_c0_g1_i1.p2 TRINITY_DN11013_c0_g1~~TRINITY_DN11013_c0_g1_i1.p2  ORF type:complete len:354 (+),score=68.64 TRINITY_DN11013_c0_g1_i1:33-1064(+)